MNAQVQPVAAEAAKQTRERVFGRVYDYEKGTVTITASFDPNFSMVFDINKAPQHVRDAYALQKAADYFSNEANEALKDEQHGDEAARRSMALETLAEAASEIEKGEIDFKTGTGLGGMRSTIGILGAVLFERGNKLVKDQFGKELTFNDLHGARAAVKTLYNSTEPKGPFTEKKDASGAVVKDKEGAVVMVPVNKDSNLTGRMIFNAIREIPDVKAAIEAKKPVAKPKAKLDGNAALG